MTSTLSFLSGSAGSVLKTVPDVSQAPKPGRSYDQHKQAYADWRAVSPVKEPVLEIFRAIADRDRQRTRWMAMLWKRLRSRVLNCSARPGELFPTCRAAGTTRVCENSCGKPPSNP
jgi:hypothetical protein